MTIPSEYGLPVVDNADMGDDKTVFPTAIEGTTYDANSSWETIDGGDGNFYIRISDLTAADPGRPSDIDYVFTFELTASPFEQSFDVVDLICATYDDSTGIAVPV